MVFTDFTRKQRLPDVEKYFHCQMYAYSNEIFRSMQRLQFSAEFNLMIEKKNIEISHFELESEDLIKNR